jgi:hypothetical protein
MLFGSDGDAVQGVAFPVKGGLLSRQTLSADVLESWISDLLIIVPQLGYASSYHSQSDESKRAST